MTVEARAGGGWCFRRPDGREYAPAYHESAPDYDWTMLRSTNAAEGLCIDSDTASTRWRGERMDFSFGVGLLCNQELKARERNHEPIPDQAAPDGPACVSAETSAGGADSEQSLGGSALI
jgi:hypothetical protein